MHRRDFLRNASAALAALGLPAFDALAQTQRQLGLRRLGQPQPFDYAWLKGHARALSQQPYQSHKRTLPAAVEALDWDQYQSIRYRQDHALWADGEGQVPGQVLPPRPVLPFAGAHVRRGGRQGAGTGL
jgi:Periplasmic glucans biosynthesis protein